MPPSSAQNNEEAIEECQSVHSIATLGSTQSDDMVECRSNPKIDFLTGTIAERVKDAKGKHDSRTDKRSQ